MQYAPSTCSIRRLWSLCAISAGLTWAAGAHPPRAAAEDGAGQAEPSAKPASKKSPLPPTAAEPSAPEPAAKPVSKKPLLPQPRTAAEPSAAEPAAKPASKKPPLPQPRTAAEPSAAAGKALADPPKADFDRVDVPASDPKPEAAEPAAGSGEAGEPHKRHPRANAKAGAARSANAAASKPRLTKEEREARKAAAKAARLSGATGRQPDAGYRKLRDGWHEAVVPAVEPATIVDVSGRVPLEIIPVNGGDKVVLTPLRDDGGFRDEDLERAARAFCPREMKRAHAISPHLLDLVYRAMRHFEAPLVRLVSGYRKDRAGSRHTQGRAIDMVLPGVSNEQLAEYVRQFGFVGVGIYPKSGFVHLDVREHSYFWMDLSLPDERSRPQPMLGDLATAMDEAARARGEAPNAYVADNDKEDRAAARSYVKRAQRKRAAAERAAERAKATATPPTAKASLLGE